jgi:hypothetical protein
MRLLRVSYRIGDVQACIGALSWSVLHPADTSLEAFEF